MPATLSARKSPRDKPRAAPAAPSSALPAAEIAYICSYRTSACSLSARTAPWSAAPLGASAEPGPVSPQIVPLYVAIGAGCGLCVYACGRNLMNYPDIVCVALSLSRRAGSDIDV